MDDQNLFAGFLTNIVGLRQLRQRDAINENVASTFRELQSTSEDEINSFLKGNNSLNSNRAAAQRVLIEPHHIQSIKAILFELRDRQQCYSPPSIEMLNRIDLEAMSLLKAARVEALNAEKARNSVTLPEMEVPKLTHENWSKFKQSVKESLGRIYGHHKIPLTYIIRDEDIGIYDLNWESREEKLIACTTLRGTLFKLDNTAVYSLLSQYIGDGEGKSLVEKEKLTRNGRSVWLTLRDHYESQAYKENLAAKANSMMKKAHYDGERRNFTIQTFYSIFSNAFNMLEEAGPAHALREAQKITAFTNGIRDAEATRCAINARKEISALPIHEQTFDRYFNSLSADLNTFQTLTLARVIEVGTPARRISSINTGRGRGDRINGRGRGRGGRGRGGRGRGGRRGRQYDRGNFAPYSAQQRVFHPELRVYKAEEFSRMTRLQKSAVLQHKLNHGWISGDTPPQGYTLDDDGRPIPIGQSSQASIAQMNSQLPPFGYPPPLN